MRRLRSGVESDPRLGITSMCSRTLWFLDEDLKKVDLNPGQMGSSETVYSGLTDLRVHIGLFPNGSIPVRIKIGGPDRCNQFPLYTRRPTPHRAFRWAAMGHKLTGKRSIDAGLVPQPLFAIRLHLLQPQCGVSEHEDITQLDLSNHCRCCSAWAFMLLFSQPCPPNGYFLRVAPCPFANVCRQKRSRRCRRSGGIFAIMSLANGQGMGDLGRRLHRTSGAPMRVSAGTSFGRQ